MTHRRVRVSPIWVVAALAVVACQRKSGEARPDAAPAIEVVSIERVAVAVVAWPEAAGPPPEGREVSGRVWEELTQVPHLELAQPAGGGDRPDATPGTFRRRARVNVEIAVDRRGDDLRAAASVALVWLDHDEALVPWASRGCEGQAGEAAEVPGLAASLVACAVGDAARALRDQEILRRAAPAELVSALDRDDPELRKVALATIAERQIREAVPRLVEMLKSDDELVRDGAIGALVALREERAIKPLTDLAAFNDLDMMRRVIDAVGAIGGDDARAYLELVATGHELPAVRELAESALARLTRRPDGGR